MNVRYSMSGYIIKFFYLIILIVKSYSELTNYQSILNDYYVKADEYSQNSLSKKAKILSNILKNKIANNPTESTTFIDTINLKKNFDSNKNIQFQPSKKKFIIYFNNSY